MPQRGSSPPVRVRIRNVPAFPPATVSMPTNLSGSLLATVVGLALLLTSCDATGPTDTVILSKNSPIPPMVEYKFKYEPNGAQPIGVVSQKADDLGSILEKNGFGRADVASARVDSVRLERLSSPETTSAAPKVFDYLTGATLYFGSNADSPRIANASFQTTARSVRLSPENSGVTDVVREGRSNAFLQLSTTNDVPVSRDKVRVTVYFRIEVQGV